MELTQVRERSDSELTRLGSEYDLKRQSLEDLEVSHGKQQHVYAVCACLAWLCPCLVLHQLVPVLAYLPVGTCQSLCHMLLTHVLATFSYPPPDRGSSLSASHPMHHSR